MFKRLAALTALTGLLFAFALPPGIAKADPAVVTRTFSVTTATTTPYLALANQSVCAVTYTSVGGGSTATVQGASDQVPTWQTVTGIGTSGVITNPSVNTQFGGVVVPTALTYIRLSFSAVTSGTIAGTITCSGGTAAFSGTVPISAASSVPVTGSLGVSAITGNGASTVAFTPLAAATPVAAIAAPATVYTGYYTWDSSVSTTTGCTIQLWDAATVPTLGTTPTHQWYFATGSAGGTFAFPIPITLGVKVANELWIGVAAGTALNGTAACNTSSAHAGFGFTYK